MGANKRPQKNVIPQLKLQPVNSSDNILDDISKIQNNVRSKLEAFQNIPILNGVMLKNIKLVVGKNLVPHKLDRNPIGFIITRQKGQADIWDTQDNNIYSTTFISINSSAIVTVDLWVF